MRKEPLMNSDVLFREKDIRSGVGVIPAEGLQTREFRIRGRFLNQALEIELVITRQEKRRSCQIFD